MDGERIATMCAVALAAVCVALGAVLLFALRPLGQAVDDP